jgi:hypothetical protein
MFNVFLRLLTIALIPLMLVFIVLVTVLYPLIFMTIWISTGESYGFIDLQWDINETIDKLTPMRFIKK